MEINSLQEGFGYLQKTREGKLFMNMQYRLQQASINDHERRILLSQHDSHVEAQKALVITCQCRNSKVHLILLPIRMQL